MLNTNVELSKNELELVINREFILTKNRIIEKVYTMFGFLSEAYKVELSNFVSFFPDEIFTTSPKIYKGENYLGLPYVMMDYPRIFSRNDVFAIRSFFWWGNYFSITLQLSGKYLHTFRDSLAMNLKKKKSEDYFICVNEDEWQHHFEESNYALLNSINFSDKIINSAFIKIAKKYPLYEWNSAPKFFEESYCEMIGLLITQAME